MSLLGRLQSVLPRLNPVDFSAGQRNDHWWGLRMSAMLQVALANSETDQEFEDCYLRVVGAFARLERESARSILHNRLHRYLAASELTPRPRTLAQRFLRDVPRRYGINADFYARHLADYTATPRENQARLAALRETYNLEIVWRDPLAGVEEADRYRLQEPDRIQFAFFVPTLAAQLSMYPVDLVERANLWRINLCDGLHFDGRPMRGLAVYDQNALFLNMAGGYIKESSCTLIHHEFFHLVDRFALELPSEDTEWARLNAPSFRYGEDGEKSGARGFTDDLPGFMTAYATTNTREDKAELFGHMVVNYAVVQKKAETDRALAAKMDLMKRRLEAACPAIDAAFWEQRRAADFWAACKPRF